MKISEMSIEQLRKHFAEFSRDQLLLSLQTREAQIESAQQSVQRTGRDADEPTEESKQRVREGSVTKLTLPRR